ncbi:MAG: alpha/beta hydrolase [Lentisphaeria bacterium]|nr:alpha/beta hydrolase [Lentisphaeria bacterium]
MITTFDSYFAPNGEKYTWKQLPYGEDPQQVLYWNTPENAREYPVVVWFHGGGMVGDGRDVPEQFWDGNLGVVECRYRTIHEDHKTNSLDALDDAARAVAWVFAHAREFGASPDKLFVGGMSAGAYLSLMIGMAPQYLEKYGCSRRDIRGILSCSGQVTTHFQLKADLGYTRLGVQPVIDEYAPLFYASADVPPTILINGEPGLDMAARPEENALLAATMRSLGHTCVQHCILQGHDHCGTVQACGWLLLQFVNRVLSAEK